MQKPYANTKEKRVTVVIIQLAFNTITIGDHLTHIVLDSHVVWPIVSEKIRLLHSYETCIKILFSRRYSIVYYVIFTWQPLQERIQQCHMNDIITARVRSTREGTVFTFFVSSLGVPQLTGPWSFPGEGGTPVPGPFPGAAVTQSSPWTWVPPSPSQDQDRGTPFPPDRTRTREQDKVWAYGTPFAFSRRRTVLFILHLNEVATPKLRIFLFFILRNHRMGQKEPASFGWWVDESHGTGDE